MKRRAFLGLIAAAIPASLILPELLIPKRSFFLPPTGGWAQPSLADLWLSYAQEVRPAGVGVTAAMSTIIRSPEIQEYGPWGVRLLVPEETDAELRARMMAALSEAPAAHKYRAGTFADLMPWVNA